MKYPKGILITDEDEGSVCFRESSIPGTNHLNCAIEYIGLRVSGNFAGKGFYLPSASYNWQIIRDNTENLVLVPTRKE